MPEITTFADAIAQTEKTDRSLLIGNGFSSQYFSYSDLLEKSEIAEGTAVRNLFSARKTVDFEEIVQFLEDAAVVETAYGNVAHSEELSADAQHVREALVRAINATHPLHREDLKANYASGAAFIKHFGKVFTLNYDLLLYWINLEETNLRDGFGLGTEANGFQNSFRTDAYCEIFNLHGGLHLFQNASGETMKALNTGDGVIRKITSTIIDEKRLPLYVAEGSSTAKMQKIKSIDYLRHCYDQLQKNAANLFIYGHSAADNDSHIYRAIFSSGVENVFFGVYEPDGEKLKKFDAQLAKYQKLGHGKTKYHFFIAETAKVWG